MVFRKPHQNVFSIEYLFDQILVELTKRGELIEKLVLPHMSIGLKKRVQNTFSLFRLKKQIVHITGDVHYALLGVFFSTRILTIHDLSFIERSRGLARFILKLLWVTLPCHFAHKITVVSESTKEEILKHVKLNPDKIRVIYNFIDEQYLSHKKESFFNAGDPRILQIGTAFNKNIERVIEALKGIPCTLVIVGQMHEHLIQKLDTAGIKYESKYRISQQELLNEYMKADLLAYVSLIEGFGMPIVEAQSLGLPVLSSNCSAMPEVAGEAALLINPYDASEIREGFKKLISDKQLRESLIAKGFENVQRFSKERIAMEYLELYRELGYVRGDVVERKV